MAPSFSRIPVAPLPGISVISGLMCNHADCCALFSNMEDSEEHAISSHDGQVASITCGIYECPDKFGNIKLYRVLDEDGEWQWNQLTTIMTSIDVRLKDDGTNQLQMGPGFVWKSALLEHPSGSLPHHREHFQVPPLPVTGQTSNTGPPPSSRISDKTLQDTQPDYIIPTPPCSQQMTPTSEASESVSRPLEATYSSSSLCSNDITTDNNDGKLLRILATVKETVNQCRICWVSREISRPHLTFRCPTKACSSTEWKEFKLDLKFPRGAVCYFCFAPFGPPFNHTRALSGTRQSPELCEYPDVLKELVYILYYNRSLREKIFSNLGISPPTTLHLYKQYITKMQVGGILGAYEVVNAYLDIRLGVL